MQKNVEKITTWNLVDIIYPRHLFDSVRIFCNSSQASDAAIHWAD